MTSTLDDAGTVLLADGTSATVRTATPADHPRVAALHARVSAQSRYRRFFSASPYAAERFLDRLAEDDPAVWSVLAERHGEVIGIATAFGDGGAAGSGRAGGSEGADRSVEVAFLVDDRLHGVGVGTLLLERLAEQGRRRGLGAFTADVLVENTAMLRVFHDAGFQLHEHASRGVVSLRMDLAADAAALAAADARTRHAQHRSLLPLLAPGSVAVVGVSRRPGSIGRAIAENAVASGFAGPVYAVGRAGLRLDRATCLTGVDELPADLDLAVVTVPPSALERVVHDLGMRGTRCCVVVTAGGAGGVLSPQLEARVVADARHHDMRVVGPNCFGTVSHLQGARLDATFGRVPSRPGGLATGSQSGGVGIALLEAARRRGTGIASFVSLGNAADVSADDLLAAWSEEPEVRAGALYLESFPRPRRFVRLAAAFGATRPLLVVYGGSSRAGVRAGASHTAARATPARVLQALFRAAGVIEATSLADLVDTAALLTEQPLPGGPRVGILANAGGLGIVAADQAHRTGLVVPELTAPTRGRVREAAPGASGTSNPVDLGAAAAPASFGAAARAVAASAEVDALLVVVAATAVTDLEPLAAAMTAVVAEFGNLPVLLVTVGAPALEGDEAAGNARGAAGDRQPTTFATSEAAVGALAHAVDYARWRRTAGRRVPVLTDEPEQPVGPREPGGSTGGSARWWTPDETRVLLGGAGIPLVEGRVVHDVSQAVTAAEDLGYPVVVKTGDPTVVHRSDQRLVRLGLTGPEDVAAAATAVLAGTDGPLVIQPQRSGPELAVGVVRDPAAGPLLMLASGGTAIDVWDDRTYLVPPLERAQALEALHGLRTWPLLTGFRGAEAVDVDAVVDLVLAVSRLAVTDPRIQELDLNPVLLTSDGPLCVDAKLRAVDRHDRDRPSHTSSPGTAASSTGASSASS
jgi:acyl-CoA synthetase (NDP forming)/GNAT superfamily N-acetyltransferase